MFEAFGKIHARIRIVDQGNFIHVDRFRYRSRPLVSVYRGRDVRAYRGFVARRRTQSAFFPAIGIRLRGKFRDDILLVRLRNPGSVLRVFRILFQEILDLFRRIVHGVRIPRKNGIVFGFIIVGILRFRDDSNAVRIFNDGILELGRRGERRLRFCSGIILSGRVRDFERLRYFGIERQFRAGDDVELHIRETRFSVGEGLRLEDGSGIRLGNSACENVS